MRQALAFAFVAIVQDFSNARWPCLAKKADPPSRAYACARGTPTPARPIHSEELADELSDDIDHRDADEFMGSAAWTGPRSRQKRAISSKMG
jgi:hypothetical protein